ncbi:MAG: hypothetical protein Q4D60_08815 [Eubacteriales bacterium]|nr:hypothetical protein [Eubacteriales bacterium]
MRIRGRKGIFGLLLLFFACFCISAKLPGAQTEAKSKIVKKDKTPREPENSDLRIVHTATKLASRRWIQSFTFDSKYYYYIQMTRPYCGDLRITRVKYKGLGKYNKAKMDLKGFGHATNLDCSVHNGVTYLWTGSHAKRGSDVSRGISCFRFQKNRRLRKCADISYKIPMGGDGKYVTNVYPAISADSSKLGVRFTYDDKQYYQIYDLVNGTQINPADPIKQVILPKTMGDFQGFDIDGSVICTIEGSPRKSFLKSYDRRRVYQPTIIRQWDYETGKVSSRLIKGAARLSFREPEGVKLTEDKKMLIMFVSHRLVNQSCNIYEVK